MHIRNVRIRPGTETVRLQLRIFVILSLTDIAVRAPGDASFHPVQQPVETARPVRLQRDPVIQLFRVDELCVHVIDRQLIGDEITFGRRIHGRLFRRGMYRQVVFRQHVGIIHRGRYRHVRNPGFVQQPVERSIEPQRIVVRLFPLAGLRVRVVLGIHAAEIARQADRKVQRRASPPENARIIQRDSVPLVSRVRRNRVVDRARMLQRDIQRTEIPPQVETFAQRKLLGFGVRRKSRRIRRFALARLYLDDAARQVAVFDRRNTRNYFDGFHVARCDIPRARSGQVAERSVRRQPYAVDLDRRTERSVPLRDAAVADRKHVVFHQVRVHGFAARQQARHVRNVDHLQMVQRRLVDHARSAHAVAVLARGNHHFGEFQVGAAQPENQIVPIAGHVQLAVQSDVPQARNIDRMLAGLHVPDRKMSIVVGNRPQVRVDHRHDGHRNPFRRLADLHSSGYRIFLCGNAQDTNAQQQSK